MRRCLPACHLTHCCFTRARRSAERLDAPFEGELLKRCREPQRSPALLQPALVMVAQELGGTVGQSRGALLKEAVDGVLEAKRGLVLY
jgi:hypothetical protein